MCLNTITKTYEAYDMNPRFAYKLLRKDNQAPFEYFTITEKWQQATQTPLHAAGRVVDKEPPAGYSTTDFSKPREAYTSGFHVFPTREEARKAKRVLGVDAVDYVLRKVEVKGIMYEGTDATAYENNYIEAHSYARGAVDSTGAGKGVKELL